MPIFEYRCNECNNLFEKIAASTSVMGKVACDKCSSGNVKKTISAGSYRISGSGGGPPLGSMSGCSAKPGFS